MNMPEITDHLNGIIQVKITMSFPLRWVNSYLLPGPDGVTIVDPGPRTPGNEEEWKKAFAELGIGLSRHPANRADASPSGSSRLCRVAAGAVRLPGMDVGTFLPGGAADVGTGFDDEPGFADAVPRPRHAGRMGLSQLEAHLNGFIPQVTPIPEVAFIDANRPLAMGGRLWAADGNGGPCSGASFLLPPGDLAIFFAGMPFCRKFPPTSA